jgi:hypothetical protein
MQHLILSTTYYQTKLAVRMLLFTTDSAALCVQDSCFTSSMMSCSSSSSIRSGGHYFKGSKGHAHRAGRRRKYARTSCKGLVLGRVIAVWCGMDTLRELHSVWLGCSYACVRCIPYFILHFTIATPADSSMALRTGAFFDLGADGVELRRFTPEDEDIAASSS